MQRMEKTGRPESEIKPLSEKAIFEQLREAKAELSIYQEKAERFQNAFEHAPVGMAIFRSDNSIMRLNKKFTQLFGYTIDDIKTVNDWFVLAYPDEDYREDISGRWNKAMEEYLIAGQKFETILGSVCCKDGSVRKIEFSFEAEGATYLTTFVDMTVFKETEHALIAEKQFNQELINNIPGIFYLYEFEGKDTSLIRWNRNYSEILGYDDSKLEGMSSKDFFGEEERDEVEGLVEKLSRQNTEVELETNMRLGDGSKVPYYFKASSFSSEEKQYLTGIGIDLSSRVKTQRELQERELQFRKLFENANTAMFTLNSEGKFIDCNHKTQSVFGYGKEEIIGKSVLFLSPARQPDGSDSFTKSEEYLQRVYNGESLLFEWTHLKSDKSPFPAIINLVPFIKNGKNYIHAILTDISDRKMRERTVFNAVIKAEENERERLAGELHDGVAPILSTIKLFTQTLIDTRNKEIVDELSTRIDDATQEAIDSLREISNKLTPHILRNFGLAEALKNFISSVNRTKEITIDFQEQGIRRMDERIEVAAYRILTEFINNTIKYAKASRIGISIKQSDSLDILYSDNGVGFVVEDTIKESKGLGLFNVNSRLQHLNGQISITSSLNEGMQAKIVIPINEL